MSSGNGSTRRVLVDKQFDPEGEPEAYRVRCGAEQITLHPGKAWPQLDTYKWVVRGLLPEPSGFHVLPSGAVEIHGEEISLQDPEGCARLQEKLHHRIEATMHYKPARPAAAAQPAPTNAEAAKRVLFQVRLDRMGHLMVACFRRGERSETGIRGLANLARDGLLLPPKSIHLDPLLRYVEIDGVRFASEPAGAEALEKVLNERYAPELKGDGHAEIEVKANPAAPSGFDIRFVTSRAGVRFEVKGHLGQEQLDTLQDTAKCQLLRPGIVLRISPPHLIIRRRRGDGSEEKIPELPDINYLHITAAELQRALNHPAIRRGVEATQTASSPESAHASPTVTEFHIVRSFPSKAFLGLEIVTLQGSRTSALTHHNIAELQHAGVFQAEVEVVLSLDNRTLSIFHNETHQEQRFVVQRSSEDGELEHVAHALTALLRSADSPLEH